MHTPSSHTSPADNATDAPIYESLVRELGDVPADARQVAEATLERAGRAVDFGLARVSPF